MSVPSSLQLLLLRSHYRRITQSAKSHPEVYEYDKAQFFALLLVQMAIMMTVLAILVLWHARHYNAKDLGEQMEQDFLRQREEVGSLNDSPS